MVEVNREVCVCRLVVSSALEVGISVVDEINSDVLCLSVAVDGEDGDVPNEELGISAVDEINSNVLCPSVIVDNEDGEVRVVDNIVSAVDPLSPVEDLNVDILVGDIDVVNVD